MPLYVLGLKIVSLPPDRPYKIENRIFKSSQLLHILPHRSVEMFILRNIVGVFKPDCIDFEQKNIVQDGFYL